MRWPWQQVETRAVDYSDSFAQYILQQAGGKGLPAEALATAALEACSGMVGRAFAAADVEATSPTVQAALNPDILELIGRQLIRAGELVCYLDTSGGELNILPAQSHNIMGGPTPSTWSYDLTLGGPTMTRTYNHVSGDSVCHFRYAAHPSTPWRGQSPLEVAALADRLSAETVKALADESAGPLANLLGLPLDGDDPTIAPFKAAISAARGGLATIENGDWGASNGAFVDLIPKRLGPTPPETLVMLMQQASNEVMAAIGINPSLFTSGSADALQNSWRLAMAGVIGPLGRKVAAELNLKLGGVALEFEELRSSDAQSRARSLAGLVDAGATLESAAAETGFKRLVAAPIPEPEVERVET